MKHPGVYIEEATTRPQPIAGVPTGITAFLGAARRGPLNRAIRVSSFHEFQRIFGGLSDRLELGYAIHQFFANGGRVAWIARIPRNTPAAGMGQRLKFLDAADHFDLLALPGITERTALATALKYAQRRRALVIIDSPRSAKNAAQMKTFARAFGTDHRSHGAVYFPWISIGDPVNPGRLRRTAPSGSIAGLISRIDSAAGVWKAPAGRGAVLTGVRKLESGVTDADGEILNPAGVNCLREFPGTGVVVWGARTLAGDDEQGSEWKYIPVRRLALFIEQSIERGTKWAVFEPNDEPLWTQIRQDVATFLQDLFHRGAFQGRTPREAWFVKCGRETLTSADIERGQLNIEVGFAPLKPAEFVVVRIQRRVGHPGKTSAVRAQAQR